MEFFERIAANWVAVSLFPMAVFLVFTLHEGGHYAAARIFGVRVLSFSIGLGPCLRRWTDRRGTLWSVHLMPLCGMVHLAGQEEGGDTHAPHEKYNARPVWQRAIIVAAGPAVNIVLALCFIGAFYVAAGIPSARPEIPGVEIGSIAEKAGILPGDVVTHIDGRAVTRYAQLRRAINADDGRGLTLTVLRGDETKDFTVVPEQVKYTTPRGFAREHARIGGIAPERPLKLAAVKSVNGVDTSGNEARAREELRRTGGAVATVALDSADGSVRLYRAVADMQLLADTPDSVQFGTWPAVFYDRPGFAEAMGAAWLDTGRLIYGTVNIARQMFPADAALFRPDVRPVRAQAPLHHDLFILLYIGALWSVFTAFFNLLPVPRLDGGVLLILGAEAALGPARAKAAAPYIMRGALLLCLAVLAFMNAGDFMSYMKMG